MCCETIHAHSQTTGWVRAPALQETDVARHGVDRFGVRQEPGRVQRVIVRRHDTDTRHRGMHPSTAPGMIGFPSGPLGRSLLCDRSCMISSGGRPNACISWRSVTILAKSFSPSSKARTMPTTLTSCASYRAKSSADRVFRFFLIHGGYFFEISTAT